MDELIKTVVLSSFGSAAMLGLAGWLFKARLSHWFNSDLERVKSEYARELELAKSSYARELEALKNSYSRELEAYRVQLISETERVKAHQEVKKAGALWILERKYKALTSLQSAVTSLFSDMYSNAHSPAAGKTKENFERLLARCQAVSNRLSDCSGYLPIALQLKISQMGMSASNLLPWVRPDSPPMDLDSRAEEVRAAMATEGQVREALHEAISELTQL